jgi:hypothetical protein
MIFFSCVDISIGIVLEAVERFFYQSAVPGPSSLQPVVKSLLRAVGVGTMKQLAAHRPKGDVCWLLFLGLLPLMISFDIDSWRAS